MYIIEDTEAEFFLLRKLNKRLCDRLYKALPEEMILAPAFTPTEDEVTSADSQVALPHQTSSLKGPIRDRKKPAQLHSIAEKIHDKNTFKPGWLNEDQDYDEEYLTIYPNTIAPSHVPTDSSNAPTSDSETPASETDSELSWDNSPEQILLSNHSSIYYH